ncbi:MAG: phosphomannomutase/phosphoglucomutase [Armatimonadota bacterium]
MDSDIFKPCDIRGIYPIEFDEDAAWHIARAFGTLINGGDVVVGGDGRLSTPNLKRALIQGLVEAGCTVHDIGFVPTPVFYYARRQLGINPGIMVTASHNPPDYNGLKLIMGRLPITEQEIKAIRDRSFIGEFAEGEGSIVHHEMIAGYEDWIIVQTKKYLCDVTRMPKVVIDCGNGSYSEIAPRVFQRLGVPFVPLYCECDGRFPGRDPNSAVASNLTKLAETVCATQVDLGIAFDGDGDRVSFVDETGSFLLPDRAIAIIMSNLREPLQPGDKVVLDIKCSAAVVEVASSLGAVPLLERSGHTYIKTRMIQEGARFGGEVSGHFFYRELEGGDDGLYSAVLMTGIVARNGSLSRLASAVPSYAITPDIRLKIRGDANAFLETIARAFPCDRISRLDGVRVQFDDGWALARASVTEPVITLRFEGRDNEALQRIMSKFLEPVPDLARRIAFDDADMYNYSDMEE